MYSYLIFTSHCTFSLLIMYYLFCFSHHWWLTFDLWPLSVAQRMVWRWCLCRGIIWGNQPTSAIRPPPPPTPSPHPSLPYLPPYPLPFLPTSHHFHFPNLFLFSFFLMSWFSIHYAFKMFLPFAESQKSINAVQQCFVENQKGTITIDLVQR